MHNAQCDIWTFRLAFLNIIYSKVCIWLWLCDLVKEKKHVNTWSSQCPHPPIGLQQCDNKWQVAHNMRQVQQWWVWAMQKWFNLMILPRWATWDSSKTQVMRSKIQRPTGTHRSAIKRNGIRKDIQRFTKQTHKLQRGSMKQTMAPMPQRPSASWKSNITRTTRIKETTQTNYSNRNQLQTLIYCWN